MHQPALIEPLAGFHRQKLMDEARLDRLVSLARRDHSPITAHVRTGLGLGGYMAALALTGALLARVLTAMAPAAELEVIVPPTLYEVTIAWPVDESSASIHCLTASPPARDTILASSAEAAHIAAALGCGQQSNGAPR